MIENLKKILKQEDTVLFIGSGVSLWSGLPSWTELIQELIEFIKENGLDSTLTEQELKRGDLLQAASYGFDKLTKPQFAQFIRKASRLGIAQPRDIHNKIIALGPTCYITTNYDKLLELSFQKWKPDIYFRTVVNKQLTETAEIVGARANKFLFKFHGDVENSDSIILTREQYRALNLGGELYHALETIKTLMLSRPIVYIGFGLRDTDFLYLRDLLINTYKGGARDHYAIMADVSDQEKDYWRRNLGIHLIDYQTILKPNGTRDHSPILKLLDNLASIKIDKQTSTPTLTPEFVLSLNRHAAKYSSFEISRLHLPLVVHPIENKKNEKYGFIFYESAVEKLLDYGPDKFILIGLPGGGKSYSLKASVARLSKSLGKTCIEDTIKLNETIVPIYVDLKLYQGNIIDLIEQNIPIGMNLSLLCSNFKVKLYLDAFNEIPREYIESKNWNTDFKSLLQQYSFSLVISSRTIDGLEELEFPGFNLDSIDEEFIKSSLVQNHLEIKGLFRNEIIALLQKPFFYKLIFENKFKIDDKTSPQRIYFELINLINKRLNDRFQISIKLLKPLSKAAIEALDNGEEAFKTSVLIRHIDEELTQSKGEAVLASDIINWLVSQDLVIPIINERISFFHQSVTEYLAATRLATIFVDNNKILKEKLGFRRWDQALYLTLSLLKKEEANKFLETLIRIDFVLALSSVKYLEEDTREIVERLLKEIYTSKSKNFEWQNQVGFILKTSVPIDKIHIPLLKKLINKKDSLGGSAVCCLINLLGYDFKNQALALLADNCYDYNFCSEIGRSIKKYVTSDDLPYLVTLCQQVQEKLNFGIIKEFDGFDSALSDIIEEFNLKIVFTAFFNPKTPLKEQQVQLEVLCNYLSDCHNNEGLKICLDLLLAGIDEIALQIHFILHFSNEEDNIDYSIFEPIHIKALISIVKNKQNKNSEWALSSLCDICSKREDIIQYVKEDIHKTNGILKAALCYAISNSKDQKIVFTALEELLTMDSKNLSKENFELLCRMDELDWKGQENLFLRLLKLKNIKLAYNLCDQLGLEDDNENGIIFDIGSINWWLEWFVEFFESKSKEWMFIDRVPMVISTYITNDKRQEFIFEFNNPNSKYRKILSRIILRKMNGLKLEDFTAESILYLIEELKNIKVDFWDNSILVDIATEKFVTESLLPLIKNSKGVELKNLETIVELIGKLHKRRYMIT